MNTGSTKANWFPYTIPPTPTRSPNDFYALTFSEDATPLKNPSQFLNWKKVNLPNGVNLGDILYWNPSSGEGGEWVVLPAPSSSDLRVLTIQNNNLAWTETEDCE